jgi:hypothetical protein
MKGREKGTGMVDLESEHVKQRAAEIMDACYVRTEKQCTLLRPLALQAAALEVDLEGAADHDNEFRATLRAYENALLTMQKACGRR